MMKRQALYDNLTCPRHYDYEMKLGKTKLGKRRIIKLNKKYIDIPVCVTLFDFIDNTKTMKI